MSLKTFALAAAILAGGFWLTTVLDRGPSGSLNVSGMGGQPGLYAAFGGIAMLLVLLVHRARR